MSEVWLGRAEAWTGKVRPVLHLVKGGHDMDAACGAKMCRWWPATLGAVSCRRCRATVQYRRFVAREGLAP